MSPRKLIPYAGFDPSEHNRPAIDPNKPHKPSSRKLICVTFNGKTMSIGEWAEHLGMPAENLRNRLRTWTVEQAITTPPGSKRLELADV